jgi:hypothetical protein
LMVNIYLFIELLHTANAVATGNVPIDVEIGGQALPALSR